LFGIFNETKYDIRFPMIHTKYLYEKTMEDLKVGDGYY